MNIKRFFLASLAVFAVLQILTYLIHGVILMDDYRATTALWRPGMDSLMWIMWITGLVFSFAFVFIFIKGYENRGITEGIRFGLIIWLLMSLPGIWNQYVVYPVPLDLTLKWLLFSLMEYLTAGMLASLIYRPAE